ncbi:hypothetical protein IAT38_004731 [Cryptococcus sp. DSM 104549]
MQAIEYMRVTMTSWCPESCSRAAMDIALGRKDPKALVARIFTLFTLRWSVLAQFVQASGSTQGEVQAYVKSATSETEVEKSTEADGCSEALSETNETGKRPQSGGDEVAENKKRDKLDPVDGDDAPSQPYEKRYMEEYLDSDEQPYRYDAWAGRYEHHVPEDEILRAIQEGMKAKLWKALPFPLRNRFRIEARESPVKVPRLFLA